MGRHVTVSCGCSFFEITHSVYFKQLADSQRVSCKTTYKSPLSPPLLRTLLPALLQNNSSSSSSSNNNTTSCHIASVSHCQTVLLRIRPRHRAALRSVGTSRHKAKENPVRSNRMLASSSSEFYSGLSCSITSFFWPWTLFAFDT